MEGGLKATGAELRGRLWWKQHPISRSSHSSLSHTHGACRLHLKTGSCCHPPAGRRRKWGPEAVGRERFCGTQPQREAGQHEVRAEAKRTTINKQKMGNHSLHYLIPSPSQAGRVRHYPRGQVFLWLDHPPSGPLCPCQLSFPPLGLGGKGGVTGAGVWLGERHRGGRMARESGEQQK